MLPFCKASLLLSRSFIMAAQTGDSYEIIVNDEAVAHDYENVTLQVKVTPIGAPSPMSSLIGAQLRPTKLPDLTPNHLLAVFIDCGITAGDAYALGVLLGLPRGSLLSSRVDSVTVTSHPSSLYAVEIVGKWRDKHPMSLDAAHEELATHLRKLDLNFAVPILRGEERKTIVDPPKVKNFLSDGAKNFTKRQAFAFGRHMNFSDNEIEEIEASLMRPVSGMTLVLELFQKVDRRNTAFRQFLLDEIIAAFMLAAQIEGAEEIKPILEMLESHELTQYGAGIPTDIIAGAELHRNAGNDSTTTRTQPDIITAANQAPRDKTATLRRKTATLRRKTATLTKKIIHKKKKKQWIGVALASAAVIALVAVVLILSLFPQLPTLPKQVIRPHDTVLYRIPQSYWVTSVDVELEGSASCSATVVSVKCSDIQQGIRISMDDVFKSDYIYLEEGSVLSLLMNDEESMDTLSCSPYYAYIFNDQQSANDNAENNFEDLACARPPDNVWCVRLINDSNGAQFISPSSSYYFIRCDRGPECDVVDSIHINVSQYNIVSTKEFEIDSVTIQTHDREKRLNLRDTTFRPYSFIEEEVCLLMQLSESSQCRDGEPPTYHVAFVGSPARRYDMIFHPFLVLLVILVIIVVAFSIFCCYKKLYNK